MEGLGKKEGHLPVLLRVPADELGGRGCQKDLLFQGRDIGGFLRNHDGGVLVARQGQTDDRGYCQYPGGPHETTLHTHIVQIYVLSVACRPGARDGPGRRLPGGSARKCRRPFKLMTR